MHFNVQLLSSVFEQSSFTSKFFGLKCKNGFFLEKNGLRVDFIKLTFRWLETGLFRLEKHQTIEILLTVDFYAFLIMLHFSKVFDIFEIHQ